MAAAAQADTDQPADKITDPAFRLSGGYGIIYGGVGFKGEVRLMRGLMASVGAGGSAMDPSSGTDYGPGFNGAAAIGLFYYPMVGNKTWQPRLGLSYGENQSYDFVHDMIADPGYMGAVTGSVADYGPSLSSGVVLQMAGGLTFEGDLFYAFRRESTTSRPSHSSAWQGAVGVGYSWGKAAGIDESFDQHPR